MEYPAKMHSLHRYVHFSFHQKYVNLHCFSQHCVFSTVYLQEIIYFQNYDIDNCILSRNLHRGNRISEANFISEENAYSTPKLVKIQAFTV